ncbi:MAG: hypothetical protein SOR94_07855 [Lawsonella sp.]|uniref:hypothetical protein n=1 Tax=Lawsonella sp. TaxID=2041415 RepID=UPI002A75B563|nr:hypothetical protein [Lawsonella sp.]MDY2979922.1 hypothetical protein [Lawsonella sp.]
MAIPLIHLVGTYPGCGVTTLSHLWGDSADERPLDSPLPAKGSPWIVPIIMGVYHPMQQSISIVQYLAGIPHLRIGGILIRPCSAEPTLDLNESIVHLRGVVGNAPIQRLDYHEDFPTKDIADLPQWDFRRPTPKRFGRDPWFRTFSQFAEITDYVVRTERSNPS